MSLLIIPGFSLPNKNWAEGIKQELSPNISTVIHYWHHWQTGFATPQWLNEEIRLIAHKVQDQSINLLAKSIGTLALVQIAQKINLTTRKLILCGLPLNDISLDDQKSYNIMASFSSPNVVCFQNESDPHASFTQVQTFLSTINPKIPVISKSRTDHEYPYASDFLHFLHT